MTFSLLSLPDDLLFRMIQQISDVRTLKALLAVPEVWSRVKDEVLLVIDGESNDDGFFKSNSWEVFGRTPREMIEDKQIVLVDFSGPVNLNKLGGKIVEMLQGTNSFIRFSKIEGRNGDEVVEYDAYPFLRDLNVCSVYVESLSVKTQGLMRYEGRIDTDNIHYGSVNARMISVHNDVRVAPGARVDIDELESLDVEPSVTPNVMEFVTRCFVPKVSKTFAIALNSGDKAHDAVRELKNALDSDANADDRVMSMISVFAKHLMPQFQKQSKNATVELKDVTFEKLGTSWIDLGYLHRLENVSFPKMETSEPNILLPGTHKLLEGKANYGDRSRWMMVPENYYSTLKTNIRPIMLNVGAPLLESLELDVQGWFPRMEKLQLPRLRRLRIIIQEQKSDDVLNKFVASRDLEIMKGVEELELETEHWYTLLTCGYTKKLKSLWIISRTMTHEGLLDELELPELESLTFDTHSGTIPRLQAPKLTKLDLTFHLKADPKMPISHYTGLKSLAIDVPHAIDWRDRLLNLPEIPLLQLESLSLDSAILEPHRQQHIIPKGYMPKLKKFSLRGYIQEIFDEMGDTIEFDLDAPWLEELYTLPKRQPAMDWVAGAPDYGPGASFFIRGYDHLKKLDLTEMPHLEIFQCAAIEEIRIFTEHYGYGLQRLKASPIPALKKVEYGSMRGRKVHRIAGDTSKVEFKIYDCDAD